MSAPSLVLTLNHAQRRIERDRIATLVSGFFEPDLVSAKPLRGWDAEWGTRDGNDDLQTWVDPITGRLMLTPAPLLKAWETTGSGIYARLGKSAFTFNDSSAWVEDAKNGSASKFLVLKDAAAGSADRSAVSTTTWPKNRPFYIAWFSSNWGDDKSVVIEFGYNSSASDAAGVCFKVRGGGTVEVWKDGRIVGEGSLVGKNQTAGQQTAGRFVSVMLFPCPQREVVLVSNLGGGFTHAFEDIDDSEVDPTITEATKFWFRVPDGKAEVEVAPIRFPASGYRAGIVTRSTVAPPAGEDPAFTRFYSEPGYGTVSVAASVVEEGDATVPFVPDGTVTDYRTRLDLTGDNEATPYCMGVMAEWPTQTELTDDSEETELQNYSLEATLDVPEHPSGVRASVVLKSPDEIDPGGSLGLKERANVPMLLEFDEITAVDGVTEPPEYVLTHQDETDRVRIAVRDRWKLLEQYRFSDPMPLDGLTLKEAFEIVATSAGFDLSELDIEDDSFNLPSAQGAGSRGDWNVLVEAGDTAAEWLERLRDTYAGTWFLGIVPTETGPVLRFRSPEDLDPEPVATVYVSDEDAVADGVTEEGWRYVARGFTERSLEPEANDVWVSGFDPKTRRPIVVHYPDTDSQDVTLAPSVRPANWLGEVRKYGYQEPALTTEDAVVRAAELLYKRLTPVRRLCEIECELLFKESGVPVWRGDVVTIYGRGDWRVVAMSVRFVQEPNDSVSFWREARYVLEKIEEETAQGAAGRLTGSSLFEMVKAHETVTVSKTVLMSKFPMPTLLLPIHTRTLP